MSQEIREILKDDAKVRLVAAKAFETVGQNIFKKYILLLFIIDTDKSGAISLDEMEDLMKDMAKQIGIPCPTKQEVQNAFKEINNNNEIGLEEFTVLVREVMKLMANN